MKRDRAEQNVVPLPYVETINGVRIALGRMSLAELTQLEDECRERVVEAQTDLQIVEYTRVQRFPDGDDAA